MKVQFARTQIIYGKEAMEKLYNAKIYLETPDLFAWTIVIIVISFVFEKCFLWLVRKGVYCVEHK